MKSTHTSCSDLGESYILQNFFQHYFRVYAHTNHFTTRYIFNIICCLSSGELRSTNIFIHDFFSTLQQQGRKWIYYSIQNSQNYDHLIVLANSAVPWNTIATGIIKTADHYSTNVCSYSTSFNIKVMRQANNSFRKRDKIRFCTSNTQYNVPINTQFLTWKITYTCAHPHMHMRVHTHTHSHTYYVYTYVHTHSSSKWQQGVEHVNNIQMHQACK